MRYVDYSSVLAAVAELSGENPSQISTEYNNRVKGFLSRRLQSGWEENFYPDLMRVEQRWFAADWISGSYVNGNIVFDVATQAYFQALKTLTTLAPTTSGVVNASGWAAVARSYSASVYSAATDYNVGDQVYYLGSYYQMHTDAGAGNIPTNVTYWGVLTPYVSAVSIDATGKTAIGTVLACWNLNPRSRQSAKELDWILTENGIEVRASNGTDPVSAWIQFRLPSNTLTGSLWASGVYTVGKQVQFSINGVSNFYKCVTLTTSLEDPSTTPAKWQLIEIPAFLERYLIQGAYADLLRSDGQLEKFKEENFLADELLADQSALLTGVSGQGQAVRVLSR
jgi:hypothetical protein